MMLFAQLNLRTSLNSEVLMRGARGACLLLGANVIWLLVTVAMLVCVGLGAISSAGNDELICTGVTFDGSDFEPDDGDSLGSELNPPL